MKLNKTLGLLTLGAVLATETAWAQSTPTGTATSTTYPQGAIATDSTPAQSSRSQKRAMKRNRKAMDQNSRMNSGTSTGTQEGQYRKSSSSEGTSINNSNTTNYNSNNVTNAPTGVGNNPSSLATPTPADQVSNGQNNSAARSSVGSEGGSGYSPSAGTTTTSGATGAAVSGASTSKEPVVKAGSTNRASSVGDFISSSPNYTTLQNALQSADLFETLKGSGPYTVFAPSNKAFKKLPASAQSGLLEGTNRDALKQLLSYHVVRGEVDAAELGRRIKAGNGKAELQTLAGSTLLAKQGSNGSIELTDDQGNTASIDAADNYKSANGVVHSIDIVLMPKGGSNTFR